MPSPSCSFASLSMSVLTIHSMETVGPVASTCVSRAAWHQSKLLKPAKEQAAYIVTKST